MSELFMEQSFPLSSREDADDIRQAVKGSLYDEDPNVEDGLADSPDAVFYVRSDYGTILNYLKDHKIELTAEEDSALIEFSSDYASLIDQERDLAEIRTIQEQDAKEIQLAGLKEFVRDNWFDNGEPLTDEAVEEAAHVLLRMRKRLAVEAMK